MPLIFWAKNPRKPPLLGQNEIVLEGWLRKRSGWNNCLKKRWCVLGRQYLCTFKEQTMDYKNPTGWLRVQECSPPTVEEDPTMTAFRVKSPDHILRLAAMSPKERDTWIASICEQFTHEWMPIVMGTHFPVGAVWSEVNGSGDCEIVARNPQGECGKMNFSSDKTGWIKCHHYPQTDRGEGLFLKPGAIIRWLPIKRGDPLPDFAVYAGYTYRDEKLYVGRNLNGQLGKINLEDGTFWNLWVPSGHRSEGRHDSGEILVLLPASGCYPSGVVNHSFDNPELSAAMFLANIEPVTKNGRPCEAWRADRSRLRNQENPVNLGGCLANVPQEAILGEGAFGKVWIAQERSTRQLFAVKNMVTKAQSTPGRVAMNEIKVAEKIKRKQHPGIVRLFLVEHFELDNRDLYVLVMEYSPGGNLQQRIKAAIVDEVYTVPEQVQTWIGQIFLALEHLHLDVVALIRDLKLENVVLSRSDSAKLTDFGYGRLFTQSDGRWSFNCPPGTAGYIAPEVLCREEYDEHADLYSFGVVTWVLLSGGVRSAKKPMPPSSSSSNFSAYENDWLMLAYCLNHQESARCNISKEASEMISALTRRNPLERPNHSGIRQTDFMKMLRLPEPHADPGAVEAWRSNPRPDRLMSEEFDLSRSSGSRLSLSPSSFASLTAEGLPSPKGGAMQNLEAHPDQDSVRIDAKEGATDGSTKQAAKSAAVEKVAAYPARSVTDDHFENTTSKRWSERRPKEYSDAVELFDAKLDLAEKSLKVLQGASPPFKLKAKTNRTELFGALPKITEAIAKLNKGNHDLMAAAFAAPSDRLPRLKRLLTHETDFESDVAEHCVRMIIISDEEMKYDKAQHHTLDNLIKAYQSAVGLTESYIYHQKTSHEALPMHSSIAVEK